MAKVRGLAADGITALHWCGAYGLPPATATGSVHRDLCLLESCVGVGEVAVSDHRGSAPSPQELLKLALHARVGGMLSGKAGLVHCHLGPGTAGLHPLRAALAASSGDLPITAFHPTHMGRSERLVQQGEGWLRDGGSLDLTCRHEAPCWRTRRRPARLGICERALPWPTCVGGATPTASPAPTLLPPAAQSAGRVPCRPGALAGCRCPPGQRDCQHRRVRQPASV